MEGSDFDVGDFVKVKEDSSLKRTYAFKGDDTFIVKSVHGNSIVVVNLKNADECHVGLPGRDGNEFYHISRVHKRRKLLIEKHKKKKKWSMTIRTPIARNIDLDIDNPAIAVFLENLRNRNNI